MWQSDLAHYSPIFHPVYFLQCFVTNYFTHCFGPNCFGPNLVHVQKISFCMSDVQVQIFSAFQRPSSNIVGMEAFPKKAGKIFSELINLSIATPSLLM